MPPAITAALTAALATAALEDCGIKAHVTSLHRLEGGVSNLTWRLALEDRDPVVLRVERERGIFQPYDVLREGRVLSALAGSAVHARAISFACDADPYITALAEAARGAMPDSPLPRLCHGDINVFNYLVGDDGGIVGVVDWEQANLGDPLSDWGLICALAALRGSPEAPEQMPLARPSLLARGRSAADLRYWMLHQLYKLAVIHRIWSEIGDIPPWYSWADVRRVGDACLDRLSR